MRPVHALHDWNAAFSNFIIHKVLPQSLQTASISAIHGQSTQSIVLKVPQKEDRMGGEVALLRPAWSKPLDAHGFRCCDCCCSGCNWRISVSMRCLHCSRNSTSSCCRQTSPKTKGVLLDTKRFIPKRFTSFETPSDRFQPSHGPLFSTLAEKTPA